MAKSKRASTKRAPAKRTPRSSQRTPRKTAAYAAAIACVDAATHECELTIDGELLTLTNLNKVLWPADEQAQLPAYTRRDHVRYLLKVGAFMLPHLKDRPLTLIRMPEGIKRQRFVQFHWE